MARERKTRGASSRLEVSDNDYDGGTLSCLLPDSEGDAETVSYEFFPPGTNPARRKDYNYT